MSDFLDVCLESNTTPNEDVMYNSLGGNIDKVEMDYIREMLSQDYSITLDTSEILEIMEDSGIDLLSIPMGDSPHDAVYEALQEAEL